MPPDRHRFPVQAGAGSSGSGGPSGETRSVRVPPHRYTPLQEQWDTIVKPLVEHLKLMVRMNTKTRSVDLKVRKHTLQRRRRR